jgi:hypothetical protein
MRMSERGAWEGWVLSAVLVAGGAAIGFAQDLEREDLESGGLERRDLEGRDLERRDLERRDLESLGIAPLSSALSLESWPLPEADGRRGDSGSGSESAGPRSEEGGGGAGAAAADAAGGRRFLGDDEEGYEGGRGLITLEGVSGMFLNPTSGTLPARSITAQYCVAILERDDHTEHQHTTFLSYGITDWLEVGALGRLNDPPEGSTVGGGGPLLRLRVLKDEDWLPELSGGGFLREGNDRVDKRTVFVAASKRLGFEENPLQLRSLRGHAGFRYIWQNSDVNEANAAIFYGGLEVEFPYDLWLVGELSNDTDVFAHQPYAFGLQWRPTRVVGLSLAGAQTGGEDQMGLYVGIGGTLAF